MYAEPGIRIAGHFVTGVEFLIAGALLLAVAALLMGHRRELQATVKPSVTTDQLAGNLARIADALERIANRRVDPATTRETAQHAAAETTGEAQSAVRVLEPEPASEEAHRVAYSIFGR